MLAANNILSEERIILQEPAIVEGTAALKLNKAIPRPADQEVFAATPWRTGNTGLSKKRDYNKSFRMLYRVVSTDQILRDSKTSTVKNAAETQYLCGGQDASMGRPTTACDPDPARQLPSPDENKLAVFSSLTSVQAARKETPSLNIAYDCEYQETSPKHRIILSYQFALYITETKILEVVFISRNFAEGNRLYLRTSREAYTRAIHA